MLLRGIIFLMLMGLTILIRLVIHHLECLEICWQKLEQNHRRKRSRILLVTCLKWKAKDVASCLFLVEFNEFYWAVQLQMVLHIRCFYAAFTSLLLKPYGASRLQAPMLNDQKCFSEDVDCTILWQAHFGTSKHISHHMHSLVAGTQLPQKSMGCNQSFV